MRATVLETPELIGKVKSYAVVLTTTASDLLVHTPDTDKSVYLKGIVGAETNAANLTFKQRSTALTGTVATTATSPTITGTGTTFTADYVAGDEIVITAGDTLTVQSVDSDTQITATGNAANTVTGKTHKKQQTLVTPEYAANQGILSQVMKGAWILATAAGYSLVMNASAAISSMLVHVQEGKP